MSEDEDIKECPRCKSENLDTRGRGAYIYGTYEYYEWFCKDCDYSEEQYIYDSVPEMQIDEE